MQMRNTALRQAVEAEEIFDTHPEVSLDFEHVQAALKKGYSKPFLLVDSNIIRNKAQRFKAAMPRVQPRRLRFSMTPPEAKSVMLKHNLPLHLALPGAFRSAKAIRST